MKTLRALTILAIALVLGQMSAPAKNRSTEKSWPGPLISTGELNKAIDVLVENGVERGKRNRERARQTWKMIESVYYQNVEGIDRTVTDSYDHDGDVIVHFETGLDNVVPGSGFILRQDRTREPIADDKILSLVKSKTGRHTVKTAKGKNAYWYEISDWDPTGSYETNRHVHLTFPGKKGVRPNLDEHSADTEITFELRDEVKSFTVIHTQNDMTKEVLVFRGCTEWYGGYELDTVSKTRDIELPVQ
jgi:hypothetical protein